MKDTRMTDCPACEGDGEVMRGVSKSCRLIDPPMEECCFCSGRGRVSYKEAEDFEGDLGDFGPKNYWEWKADQS